MSNNAHNTTKSTPSGNDEDVAMASNTKPIDLKASQSFVKDILRYSLAHVIYIGFTAILTFLLPRFLSIEGYGYYRLFILYASFVGVIHLGLMDGLLLRWAAEPARRMRSELAPALAFLVLEQSIFVIPILGIALIRFRHSNILWMCGAIGFYAIVWNVSTLAQYALQASKQFGILSVFTIATPGLLLACVLVLKVSKHLTLTSVICVYLGIAVVLAVYIWTRVGRHVNWHWRPVGYAWALGLTHVRLGWSVLAANLLALVIFSFDRVFISVGFSIREFAIYSFASNALGIVYALVLSVGRVVFPYLSDGMSRERQTRTYGMGESLVLVLWSVSLAAYFPLQAVVPQWLPNYDGSLPLIRILMLSTGFTAIIHILHSSYFRSALQTTRLLLGTCIGMACAGGFLTAASATRRLQPIAIAMVAAIAVWWFANEMLLLNVTGRSFQRVFRTLCLTAMCATMFLWCSRFNSASLGLIVYLATAVLVMSMGFRSVLRTVPWARVLPFLNLAGQGEM